MTLSAPETDDLLDKVKTLLATNTFNLDDQLLIARMVECLGDPRGMVRLSFAEGLGLVGKPAIPCLLEALVHHPNPVVRRAAGKTLTLIGDPRTVPPLIHALLNDEDTVVKSSVIGALAKIGFASVPPLLEILAAPDHPESTKGQAAWALAFIGAEAKEYLYPAIDSNSAQVRMAVIGAIATIAADNPNIEAITLLTNALSDVDEDVRCEAATALGNIPHRPSIPALVELLHHSSAGSRKAAALALMKMEDRSVLQPLQLALQQEPETSIQQVIKLAIDRVEKQSEEL